jgi:hypothetical protein
MVELATAALAAALLNNSVSAVDKVYNWWLAKKRKGQLPRYCAMTLKRKCCNMWSYGRKLVTA